jgi:hypothetical protein
MAVTRHRIVHHAFYVGGLFLPLPVPRARQKQRTHTGAVQDFCCFLCSNTASGCASVPWEDLSTGTFSPTYSLHCLKTEAAALHLAGLPANCLLSTVT